MMSIGHTMSSCPRTIEGNLLTPKKGSLPHLPHHMAHLSIFPPYVHQKPIKPCKKPPKGLKCLQKAIKPSFQLKIRGGDPLLHIHNHKYPASAKIAREILAHH